MLIQELLHQIEAGKGKKYLRYGLAGLAVLLLLVVFNWRGFRNFATQEAMDSAQLARNIAEGKGYTTDFIRPFSIYLLQRKNQPLSLTPGAPAVPDLAQLKGAHPDLANPPVYPFILAGLFKVLPFEFKTSRTAPFWSESGRFWRYQPDFLIGLFNQALLLLVVLLTGLLARKLFDPMVGFTTAILLLGTELLWRFSVSGLSTILLMLILVGLFWVLALYEEEQRDPQGGFYWIYVLAISAAALVGIGALTRYSFGWLIVPVIIFIIWLGKESRAQLGAVTAVAFLIVITPWIVRNYSVSGTPLGTAGYAFLENTSMLPGNALQKSLEPTLDFPPLRALRAKFMSNTAGIIKEELPKLGGTYVTAFFFVGLLVSFRSAALRRQRMFLLGCLILLILVQALGRTHLTEAVPVLNSENLLVLLTPMVMVFGVGFFFTMLDQVKDRHPSVLRGVIGTFGVVMSLPMLLVFVTPKTTPVVYPPYFPPALEAVSGLLKTNELAMSDVPWAIAWYGNRQCVWTTTLAHDHFFKINDYMKPIVMLHLSPVTTDDKFVKAALDGNNNSWGTFSIETILRKQPPSWFPLKSPVPGLISDQIVLFDWNRWRNMRENQP